MNRSAWPQPLAWLMLQLLLIGLGLMSVGWNLIALVLHPLLPRASGLRIGRAGISGGYRMFWRVARISGLLRMDASALRPLAEERGLIIVANHPSLLDALMLVAELPRSACVMKASLARNPFLGPGARLARYIRNDSPRRMVREAVEDLRAGGQLVLFPEGTRTTRNPINPLQLGFAAIARRAGVPVQVVFIDTTSPYLAKGWPLWRLPPLPIEFSVRMGRRFEPGTDFHHLVLEVERYLAAGVRPAPRP
ncbi:MAG: lysophospholipid acyltransferase family protein [Burkholderiaceae bacterium]